MYSRSAISTPYFSYEKAVALRRMAPSAGAALPRYLLAPEVTVLLDYLPDQRHRLLFETLWNTGARINECLALTPAEFVLDGIAPFVILKTLKQRNRGGNNSPVSVIDIPETPRSSLCSHAQIPRPAP